MPSSTNGDNPTGGGEIELAPGVRLPKSAIALRFTRASGPGGQNVNKVNTQAELRITVEDLVEVGGLARDAATRLRRSAGSKLTNADEIVIASSEHRTQRQNRQACFERLREMIVQAQIRPKKRRPTRPSRGAVERRLKEKKQRSETKSRRSKVDPD